MAMARLHSLSTLRKIFKAKTLSASPFCGLASFASQTRAKVPRAQGQVGSRAARWRCRGRRNEPVPRVVMSLKSSHRRCFDDLPTCFWFGSFATSFGERGVFELQDSQVAMRCLSSSFLTLNCSLVSELDLCRDRPRLSPWLEVLWCRLEKSCFAAEAIAVDGPRRTRAWKSRRAARQGWEVWRM